MQQMKRTIVIAKQQNFSDLIGSVSVFSKGNSSPLRYLGTSFNCLISVSFYILFKENKKFHKLFSVLRYNSPNVFLFENKHSLYTIDVLKLALFG